jgi:flagellar biosynthesis GTPase FlhF
MSLSRIPLTRVFRAKSNSTSSTSSTPDLDSIRTDVTSPLFDGYSPYDVLGDLTPRDITPKDITPIVRRGTTDSFAPKQFKNTTLARRGTDSVVPKDVSDSRSVSSSRKTSPNSSPKPLPSVPRFNMSQSNGGPRPSGTRNAKMLEYERQAEERVKEQLRMEEERERMSTEQTNIAQEQERIAKEQYEMDQYYEAEALRHAEEMRVHQEEVRRHQARVREHQMRLQDHEASSEAFARVIAMPAKPGRDRQISFMGPPSTKTTMNGANERNGGAPAQFPGI